MKQYSTTGLLKFADDTFLVWVFLLMNACTGERFPVSAVLKHWTGYEHIHKDIADMPLSLRDPCSSSAVEAVPP